MLTRRIGLHGVSLEVSLPDSLAEFLDFDFALFQDTAPNPSGLRIELHLQAEELPKGLRESFRASHFVVFQQPDMRYVLYPGPEPCWLRWDCRGGLLQLFSRSPESGYLRLQLAIHSRLGELLEGRGLHRVHGLGLESGQGGILLLLPPSGGKSSLAAQLWAAACSPLRLLSEDTPLVDRQGHLWPYPFRLALRHPPPGECRHRGGKWLLNPRDRPELWCPAPVPVRHLMVGAWITDPQPVLEHLPRWRAMRSLMRDLVLGYGIPQLIELWWPQGLSQHRRKSRHLLGRWQAALKLASRVRCQKLWLCPSVGANLSLLEATLA